MFDWVVRVCRTAVAILRREGGQERWRLLIRIAVVLALAGFCAETRGLRLNFSYDSTYYWSATRALLAGAPLTSQLYFSERIARASNDERIADLHQWVTMEAEPQEGVVPREVHPWTAWPPGFPLLAGGFFALLPLRPAAWACQAVALACFLMLVAAVARAMRGERFAFVATVIVAGLPAVHEVARVFSSDLWFMDCVLLALWSTLRWRESQRTRWLLLASGAAAASFTFRYLGLITCVWVVAQCGPRIRDLVRASIIPTLVVIPIVLRNQWLTGHWGGVQRLPSDRGWGANLLDTAIGALTGALPLVREVPGKLDLVLSAAAVGVLVFGLVGALRESRLAKVRSNGMGLLLGFSGLYAVALIAIRSRVLTDEIGQRLLLPVIVLVALAGLAKLAERLRTDVAKRWLVLAVPAYGVAVGASSAFSSQADIGSAGSPRGAVAAAALVEQVLAANGREASAVIYSNRAVELHFVLQMPVHWLPSPAALPKIPHVGTRAATFVIRRNSGYFPCARFEAEYRSWLAQHASKTVQGRDFDVFVVANKAPTVLPAALPNLRACAGSPLGATARETFKR